jgi:hypothetical protein
MSILFLTSFDFLFLGHTFTYAEGKYYLFGGLANDSKDPKQNVPR